MNLKSYLFIFLLFFLFFSSCEKNEEFAYDVNILIKTNWDYPFIEEGSADHVGPAPIDFNENGQVIFGEAIYDYWQVRDSRSILVQKRGQIWQILELNSDKMYVEKLKYPTGEFLVRCIYYPIEEQ